MATKSDTWNETTPPGTEDRRRGDNRIRDQKRDTRERVGEEHEFTATSGTGDIEGRHLEGSARAHRSTTTDADPVLVAAHSEGRLLIKDVMTLPADNGLKHGDGTTSWIDTPIGIDNMTKSLQFGAMVRNVEIINSTTVEADLPLGAYRALEINTSADFYDYTPQASGNTLMVWHQSTWQCAVNTFGVFSGRFDTINIDEASVDEGTTRQACGSDIIASGTGRTQIGFWTTYPIPGTADVKIEVVAYSSNGAAWATIANRIKRTIIVEIGTN